MPGEAGVIIWLSYDKLLRKYPDAGIVITGDFNGLNTDSLSRILKLVQVAKKSTRGSNILDKILFLTVVSCILNLLFCVQLESLTITVFY
jgi:hypothetical protein